MKERKCLSVETVMRKEHGKLKSVAVLWRKTKRCTVPETFHILPHPQLPTQGHFIPTSQVRKLRLSGGRRSPLGAAPWRWFGLWASPLAPEEFCVEPVNKECGSPAWGRPRSVPPPPWPHEDLQQTLTAPNNFVRVSTDDTCATGTKFPTPSFAVSSHAGCHREWMDEPVPLQTSHLQ